MENRKQKEENEMEIDLVSLFFYLIDKWKLLFLGAVVGVVLAGALVFFQTPMYESNSTLYVLSKTTSITSMADLQVGTELTSDFSVIATSKPVIDGAIKTLKKDNIKLTRKEIKQMVASAITEFCVTLYQLWSIRKNVVFDVPKKFVISTLTGTVFMAIAVIICEMIIKSELVCIFIAIFVGVIAYVLTSYFMGNEITIEICRKINNYVNFHNKVQLK